MQAGGADGCSVPPTPTPTPKPARQPGSGVTLLQSPPPPPAISREQPFRSLTFCRIYTTSRRPSQERFLDKILNMQIRDRALTSDRLHDHSLAEATHAVRGWRVGGVRSIYR